MSGDSASTLERLAALIAHVAPTSVRPETITLGASLREDLAFDSIGLVALLALAEEAFGVAFSGNSQQVTDIQTVGDAIDLIDSLTGVA